MQELPLFKAVEVQRDAGQRLLEIIERSVHRIGIKEYAFLIGKEVNQVRDALHQNNKHFSVLWLPMLLSRDTEGATELLNYLCDVAGKEHPADVAALTPEDKVKHYEGIFERHGLWPLVGRPERRPVKYHKGRPVYEGDAIKED